jgi:DNA-binding transcriptional MerR regulator
MQRSLQTLTIQEASQRLKVTKHTLRFWEKKLDGVIVPLRTKGGQRRYTSDHLHVIEEIKNLKRKGLSLLDIKNKLDDSYNSGEDNSNSQRIHLLANQLAEVVRAAVYRFFEGESLD